ncbi:MAG: YhfC family intramembrane metalloprotease [Ardenticatenaceae bacterium]|nr:YhfC family intramembrane metalloprotease [Anaerolineales bacterium]MCB8920128.1 YhfC family intramembrane metalloprotease [Ardenticatenaceae bacterium]MCB8992190.1 YhfC family intramembrane metalloprotease [Ardenticatenaceae bacterium]MCB9005079.1 YhfC family intramembrane metalloprotease [Ardenticatenaceae bacterium]
MSYWPYFLNAFLMIAMPIVLARWIAARRRPGWELAGMGALTFVLSQVGHIPFNWLVLQRFALIPTDVTVFGNLLIYAAFLGLSSGVFEEGARYLTYRYWATEARTWGKGLMLGAGHGGIESLLLGVLVAINYVAMAAIDRGVWMPDIPAEQWPLVQAQVTAVFNAPWYLILLGAVERLFALCLHLAASLLVMQVFVRRQKRWLLAAIGLHGVANGVAVVTAVTWNAYISELALAGVALLSVGIIFALRTPEPVEPELPLLPEPGPAPALQMDVTAESLENSRYT